MNKKNKKEWNMGIILGIIFSAGLIFGVIAVPPSQVYINSFLQPIQYNDIFQQYQINGWYIYFHETCMNNETTTISHDDANYTFPSCGGWTNGYKDIHIVVPENISYFSTFDLYNICMHEKCHNYVSGMDKDLEEYYCIEMSRLIKSDEVCLQLIEIVKNDSVFEDIVIDKSS